MAASASAGALVGGSLAFAFAPAPAAAPSTSAHGGALLRGSASTGTGASTAAESSAGAAAASSAGASPGASTGEAAASSGGAAAAGFGQAFAGAVAVAGALVAAKRSRRGKRASVQRAARGGDAPVLRLGTRGSPLALAQAYEAKRRLGEAFPELAGEDAVQIQIISTTGDQRLEISLAEIGGKGLFTRELDTALMNGEVDFCVHSTKDVPTWLVPNTELVTMLPREDSRDVMIARDPSISKLEDLPAGSVIGTASLRRQAQILAVNPGVKCVNFRGNVQTRLRKLQNGVVDATMLAYAGLRRMSMEEHITKILSWEEMLPAISQGAISFQCKSDDEKTLNYLRTLNHEPTKIAVTCERSFLATLDGNCKTPIAGQAKVENGEIHLQGLVASPDGKTIFRAERRGPVAEAEAIGKACGLDIRSQAGENFFAEMQSYVQALQAANEKPVAVAPA